MQRYGPDFYGFHRVFGLDDQADRAVNSAACIPAAIRFQTVVHRHTQKVFPFPHFSGNVCGKFRIAIPVFRDRLAVQIYNSILINTFKQNADFLFRIFLGDSKMFFIAIFPTGKIAAVFAIVAVFLPRFLQHGVVRQRYGFGFSVLPTE